MESEWDEVEWNRKREPVVEIELFRLLDPPRRSLFISIERVPFKMRDSPRYRSLMAVISNGSSNYLDHGPRRIFHATIYRRKIISSILR